MPSGYYPRYASAAQAFYSGRDKRYDDPQKQAAYNAESDEMFNKLIAGIVGTGTTEPQSVERALGAQGGPEVGNIGSEFSLLGGERKLGEKERMEPGAYSLAKFPGIEHQIWAAKAGFIPKGYHWSSYLNESPDEREYREAAQKRFATTQEKILGMDETNPLLGKYAQRRKNNRFSAMGRR